MLGSPVVEDEPFLLGAMPTEVLSSALEALATDPGALPCWRCPWARIDAPRGRSCACRCDLDIAAPASALGVAEEVKECAPVTAETSDAGPALVD